MLNRRSPRFIGHNPAGSWAIYLLLGLGLLIVITGLLAMGGEEWQGPLAGLLNYPQGRVAHDFHEWLAWLMLGYGARAGCGSLPCEAILSCQVMGNGMGYGDVMATHDSSV